MQRTTTSQGKETILLHTGPKSDFKIVTLWLKMTSWKAGATSICQPESFQAVPFVFLLIHRTDIPQRPSAQPHHVLTSTWIRRQETKVSTLEQVVKLNSSPAIQWWYIIFLREIGKHTLRYSSAVALIKNKLDNTQLSINQKCYLDLLSWILWNNKHSITQRPLSLKALGFVCFLLSVTFIQRISPMDPGQ